MFHSRKQSRRNTRVTYVHVSPFLQTSAERDTEGKSTRNTYICMDHLSLSPSHRRSQDRRPALNRDAVYSASRAALVVSLALGLAGQSVQAKAQDAAAAPAAAPAAAEPAPAPAPPAPPPYSLPWQLRPTLAVTVLRSDTAFAFYKPKGADAGGTTIASMLLGAYKLTDSFSPMVRLGVVSNSPPTPAGAPDPESGFSFINPVLGGTYLLKLSPELKLALFLGVTIPVGGGGGDKPDPTTLAATRAGIPARSAMDNAMFAVNDFTVFPGVDLAFQKSGFTVQGELTLLQLFRVKGDKGDPTAAAPIPPPNPDSSKTNFTMGLHAGYFFIPQLSAGVELRHQRWLSTPKAVKLDEALPDAAQLGLRDTTTMALGLRAHFKVGDTTWIRPGIAYVRGLDDPMSVNEYNILQLDVPVVF